MSAGVCGDKEPSIFNSLLAWYGCHESSGSSRLNSTGSGSDLAEPVGPISSLNGLIGMAASFDTTKYLRVMSPIVREGPFSMSCWCKPTNLATRYIMSQGSSTGLYFLMTSSLVRFGLSTGLMATHSKALTLGAWTHLAGTFDGRSAKLFVNGLLQDHQVGSATYTASTFGIGSLSSNGTSIFNGLIQMAGVWGRALTPGNVASLYNNGAGMDYPFNGA